MALKTHICKCGGNRFKQPKGLNIRTVDPNPDSEGNEKHNFTIKAGGKDAGSLLTSCMMEPPVLVQGFQDKGKGHWRLVPASLDQLCTTLY